MTWVFPEGWNALEQRWEADGLGEGGGDGTEGYARDALAERLNALREGSGRTYASLARRIGISGSTLHRYCTGRTVPVEFAPVERLARLCGAPGEEREALHRLWVRAAAERVDRPGAEFGQGPGGASPAMAGSGVAGAPGDSVPVLVGEVGERGPGGEGRGGSEAGPAGRARRMRQAWRVRRVRRSGQALAALAAAAVVLAVVAAFGGSGSPLPPGQERQPSGAEGPGRPSAGVAGPLPGSGSPRPGASSSPKAPRGTPSEGPEASTPPGTGPRQVSPKPGTGPDGAAGAGPGSDSGTSSGSARTPFTWISDDQVWKHGCDHSYLLDRAPSAVPPPPVEADAGAWATALGAVHADETGVRITVQGRDQRAVVLEALRIRVVERRSPAPGQVYRMSSGCGGSLTPRMFDVDLDVPRPVAHSVPGNDSGVPIEAIAFPYRVSSSDPEILLVTGRTVGCDCDWFAELTWSSGGRSGTVRVDDDGRPFRTSGSRGRPVHDYDTGAGRWAPVRDDDEAGSTDEAGGTGGGRESGGDGETAGR
ncbi:helix-turn-helix domain-containing protein [Streptomyces sp. NPDC049916]|uniref:helix-turn-helix domain-containing protein n=1 Tax=Streptomyces sp. NPDC049916 TaxID=3155156 RepID=UPI00342428D5